MNRENDAIPLHDNDSRQAVSYRALPAIVLLVSVWAATAAAGQPVSGADLATCSSQETDEQKLSCFEALAGRHDEAGEATEKQAATAATPKPENERQPRETPRQLTSTGPTLPEIDSAAGREHLDDAKPLSEPEPEVVTATITKVTRGRNRHYYFHMDNGQIWRQMESGYVHFPKDRAFDVHISRGLMGDYQMRVGGEGRMTRIVRVQ